MPNYAQGVFPFFQGLVVVSRWKVWNNLCQTVSLCEGMKTTASKAVLRVCMYTIIGTTQSMKLHPGFGGSWENTLVITTTPITTTVSTGNNCATPVLHRYGWRSPSSVFEKRKVSSSSPHWRADQASGQLRHSKASTQIENTTRP